MAHVIRPATPRDVLRIVDMVEALRAAVDGPIPVDRPHTARSLVSLIASPDGAVWVSEGGFIAGCLTSTVISPAPIAAELGWYATDGSGQALLRTFEAWAADRGAMVVKLSCNGGAVQRMLERQGYRVAEIQMVKELR